MKPPDGTNRKGQGNESLLEQTFEELKLSGNLPSPSGVGMRILTLTQGEDYSTLEIAETIQADPALTGRLLKLANSAESGSVEPISTVGEATMRLGVRSVRNVALGLSLVSANRSGGCQGFDYDRYWADSLARAVAAQSVSVQTGIGVPAEAYVCGLLSNIGTLALASVYPDEFADLLADAPDAELSELAKLERERFAIHHTEVAAYMMSDWGLPETLCLAVQDAEHEPKRASDDAAPSSEITTIADVLRAARVIAEVCMASDDDDASRWTRHRDRLDELMAQLGMESSDFFAFCQRVVAAWREWGSILTIPTDMAVGFEEVHRRGSEQVGEEASSVPAEGETLADLAPAPEGPRLELQLASGRGLKVLAVDDDPMQLKMLERYLKRLGADVMTARDGKQALQIALATRPQVVIADWMMPEMEGIELCRTLRRIKVGRDIYFVVLTGREEEERIVEAFDAGVDDYVVKPFIPKILLARIKAGKRVTELENERLLDQDKILKQARDISLLNRRFRNLALTDLLTELRNRRYAMERLTQEWSSCERTGKALSVVMVDIDYFKKVNDTWGHDAGDIVLKDTARVLRREIRQGDDAVRMGGEEFLIICFGTPEEQAAICAERVRRSVEANIVQGDGFEHGVTVSLGVAQRTGETPTVDALLKAADEAVYAAKHAGRNCVCCYRNLDQGTRKSA